MGDLSAIPSGISFAGSGIRVDDRSQRENLGKAVEALRRAELNLLLFPWDEVRRQEFGRCHQKVYLFRAALKAVGSDG
jgi:hypothetical protein